MDCLIFYAGRNEVCDLKMEQAFINYMGWEGNVCIAHPYVINADKELIDRIAQNDMIRGGNYRSRRLLWTTRTGAPYPFGRSQTK